MLDMRVYIVPQHIWDTVPGQAVSDYENGVPVVGNGPFQLTSYKPAEYAVMTANKNYWGGAPKIDELDFVYYQDADTMVADLTSGSLQGAWGLSEAQYRELQNSSTYKPRRLHRPRARRARLQLLHGPLAGQPGPQGLALPPGAAVGGRPQQARADRLRRPGPAGHVGAGVAPVEQPGLALAAARRPDVLVQFEEGRPHARCGRLPAETRRARRQAAAGRSSCACGPGRAPLRASRPAS